MSTAVVMPPDPPGRHNFTQVPIGSLHVTGQVVLVDGGYSLR